MKKALHIKNAPPAAGAYSLAIKAGDFIFTSGRSARDPSGKIVGTTVEEQTRNILEQISALLQEGGATLNDIVKATVHLSDLSLFGRYNAVYSQKIPEPRPARTTVGSELGEGILVEIDVVAYARKQER